MAEQDKIREARRRRILENSESRLQRILGVTAAAKGKQLITFPWF